MFGLDVLVHTHKAVGQPRLLVHLGSHPLPFLLGPVEVAEALELPGLLLVVLAGLRLWHQNDPCVTLWG